LNYGGKYDITKKTSFIVMRRLRALIKKRLLKSSLSLIKDEDPCFIELIYMGSILEAHMIVTYTIKKII
jgi:hypothetical protein